MYIYITVLKIVAPKLGQVSCVLLCVRTRTGITYGYMCSVSVSRRCYMTAGELFSTKRWLRYSLYPLCLSYYPPLLLLGFVSLGLCWRVWEFCDCSSSVRRHSMREKHRLSLKEARDEAKYRISINTDDSPSDDTSAPNSPQVPADWILVTSWLWQTPTLSGCTHSLTHSLTAMSMLQAPVTNIDDIDVMISENNVTTITISSTPADDPGSAPDRQLIEPPSATAGQVSPPTDSEKATDQSKPPSQNGTVYTETSAKMRHNGDPAKSSSLLNRVSATIKLNDDDTVTIIGPTKPSTTTTTTDELPASTETTRHSRAQPTKAQPTDKPSNGNSHTGEKENRRNKSEIPASSAGSGDPPLKRFSAVGQPAIGEEKRSSKGCCVISWRCRIPPYDK